MKLRKLELKDAPQMLEWMHDKSVTCNLYTDFSSKTMADCETFISNSICDDTLHMAIVSNNDEYMGTVSLKHIDSNSKSAEFAITVRSEAMGRGYAWFGMQEIINIAFNKMNLNSVYWCVDESNTRAIKFYNKHNFHETIDIPDSVRKRYDEKLFLKWYSVLKGDVIDERNEVAGCKILHIKTIATIESGELSFFEGSKDIPFDIKRVYYISKVPEGIRRGFHAHKALKQLLVCPYGRILLSLENSNGREEIELSDPSIGVLIDIPTWREMVWMQEDSVLMVAASDFYDPEDYIRNYQSFKNYIGQE